MYTLFDEPLKLCHKFVDSKEIYSPRLRSFINFIQHEGKRAKSIEIRELLATEENPRVKVQNEETQVCQELKDIKRNEILQLSKSRQLYESAHELRLLATQLRSAWIAKELVEQKRGKEHLVEAALKQKEAEITEWLHACNKAKESLAEEEEEQRLKKYRLMEALKKQMAEIQEQRNQEKQAILKERDQMQKQLQAMKKEDQLERERLMKYHLKMKDEMEASYRELAERKKLKKAELMRSAKESMPLSKKTHELNVKIEEEKKRVRKERQALSDRLGTYLEGIQKKKEQHDEFLMELLIEERIAKEDQLVRQNFAKQSKTSITLRNDLEFYSNVIKPQRAQRLRDERMQSYIEEQKYLAEYDVLAKRKMKNQQQLDIENRKILKAMIEERRQQNALAKAAKRKEERLMLEAEKEHDKRIKLEAVRLIKTQPPEVLGYLSTKVLSPSQMAQLKIPSTNTV